MMNDLTHVAAIICGANPHKPVQYAVNRAKELLALVADPEPVKPPKPVTAAKLIETRNP